MIDSSRKIICTLCNLCQAIVGHKSDTLRGERESISNSRNNKDTVILFHKVKHEVAAIKA